MGLAYDKRNGITIVVDIERLQCTGALWVTGKSCRTNATLLLWCVLPGPLLLLDVGLAAGAILLKFLCLMPWNQFAPLCVGQGWLSPLGPHAARLGLHMLLCLLP